MMSTGWNATRMDNSRTCNQCCPYHLASKVRVCPVKSTRRWIKTSFICDIYVKIIVFLFFGHPNRNPKARKKVYKTTIKDMVLIGKLGKLALLHFSQRNWRQVSSGRIPLQANENGLEWKIIAQKRLWYIGILTISCDVHCDELSVLATHC